MNIENIESLLEKLVSSNEQILDKLDDIKYEVGTIKDELDWLKGSSYAKTVHDGFNELSGKLDAIDSSIFRLDMKW